MRSILFLSVLATALISYPAHADVMSFSFSGTWADSAGVINAGDAFSGAATYDTADETLNTFCECEQAPLLSLVFNMPSGDGLSLSSVSDPKLEEFAPEALYIGGDFFTVDFVEQNYQFDFQQALGNNVFTEVFGFTNILQNSGFLGESGVATYSTSGPTAVPEPRDLGLSCLALMLPI